MAEAKTPSASYLPGTDPDIVEANRRYQEALDTLTQSLDTRKNRYFDPVMLSMAQGFLAPTQTGSFGESLGNVAGKVGPAEAAAMKEQQDIAQQKVGVAGQGLELQRLKSRDTELSRFLGDLPPAGAKQAPIAGPLSGAITGPAAPPAAPPVAAAEPVGPLSAPTTPVTTQVAETKIEPPAGPLSTPPAEIKTITPQSVAKGPLSTSDKPAGFETIEGIQVAPPNPSFMSSRDYVRLNRFDKSKSPGDLIKEGQEIEQKRYRDKEGGVLDLATGKFYQYPTGKTEEIQLYGFPGTFKVDARTAAQLSLYAANNDPRYHDLAERVVKGPEKRKTDESGKPSEPTRMLSKEQLELEAEKNKKLQSAQIESEIESRKDFNQRKKDADDTITTANVFRRFAADPNAKSMFGILNNDKISSAVATLVRDGVGLPGFTVGTKAIEDIMRNAGLNASDQAKYRTFLMYATQMQLQQSKYMKGSVSDFEQRLMANAGITGQDTPETIRMKADLLTRRAQFDRRVAKVFKDSKMTADEFLDSDKYNEMRDKYNEDLADLAAGSKVLAAPAKTNNSGANQPSDGYIRDEKTGMIRRKRQGE
tara:strand:- start:11418 stop:13190 length:1773 start_codon:yes stop_codon:yes gene_type:complete